jgi:hypothetical protein
MCALAVVVSLFALTVSARAKFMQHHDLASLAFQADAIVVAERTGGPDNAAAYHVVNVLAGQGLRVGDAITINQASYVVGAEGWFGERMDGPIEPIAILFLRYEPTRFPLALRRPSDPAWWLVHSGLRIIAGGRAYRFEQRINPGPYFPVPQGRDPEDIHGVATGVHWDRAELERAIIGAVERAERARSAIAARDPARILALFQADPVDATWGPFPGSHYEDRIATLGFDALIDAGEIDAALDVRARIRGWRQRAVVIDDTAILARSESSFAPLSRRIAALSLALFPSNDTLRRLIAIVRDENAPAALRVATIRVLAGYARFAPTGWPAQRRTLAADLQSLVRELTPRAPGSVRVELVACAVQWKLDGAVPEQHAIAAAATQRDRVVAYHVAAAPGVQVEYRGVTLLRSDGTACDATNLGGWQTEGDWHGTIDAGWCAEATQARIDVRHGGRDRAWTIPIEH